MTIRFILQITIFLTLAVYLILFNFTESRRTVTFRDQRNQAVLISFTAQMGANSIFGTIEGTIVKASIMPYYNALTQGKELVTANPALARQLS